MTNTMATIPQEKLDLFEGQGKEITTQARNIQVSNADDVRDASEFLKKVKVSIKSIDAFRTSLTKPLYDAKKQLDDRFKELVLPLKQAEAQVKKTIIVWKRAEDARLAEIERRKRIQEAHEAKGHQVKKEIVVPEPEQNTLGKAQFRN